MNLMALTQLQTASLLSVSARSLRDWVQAPRNADGTYSGPAIVKFYLARLAGADDFDNQRERLAAAQAEKVETENLFKRGELAEVAEISKVWDEHISNARAKMLSIPSKLSPQLINISDPNVIASRIRSEIYIIINELAESSNADQEKMGKSHDSIEGVNQELEISANTNGQSVG